MLFVAMPLGRGGGSVFFFSFFPCRQNLNSHRCLLQMVRQVETELLAVSAGDHMSAALSSALSELGATDKGLSCVRTAEGQYVIKAPEPGRGIKEATIRVKVSGEVRSYGRLRRCERAGSEAGGVNARGLKQMWQSKETAQRALDRRPFQCDVALPQAGRTRSCTWCQRLLSTNEQTPQGGKFIVQRAPLRGISRVAHCHSPHHHHPPLLSLERAGAKGRRLRHAQGIFAAAVSFILRPPFRVIRRLGKDAKGRQVNVLRLVHVEVLAVVLGNGGGFLLQLCQLLREGRVNGPHVHHMLAAPLFLQLNRAHDGAARESCVRV